MNKNISISYIFLAAALAVPGSLISMTPLTGPDLENQYNAAIQNRNWDTAQKTLNQMKSLNINTKRLQEKLDGLKRRPAPVPPKRHIIPVPSIAPATAEAQIKKLEAEVHQRDQHIKNLEADRAAQLTAKDTQIAALKKQVSDAIATSNQTQDEMRLNEELARTRQEVVKHLTTIEQLNKKAAKSDALQQENNTLHENLDKANQEFKKEYEKLLKQNDELMKKYDEALKVAEEAKDAAASMAETASEQQQTIIEQKRRINQLEKTLNAKSILL